VTAAQILACWNAVAHIPGMNGSSSVVAIILNCGPIAGSDGRPQASGPKHYLRFASLTPGFTSLPSLTCGACLTSPAAVAARPLVSECFKAYEGCGATPLFEWFTCLKWKPLERCWLINKDSAEWKVLNWMVLPESMGGSSFEFDEKFLPRTSRRRYFIMGGNSGMQPRLRAGLEDEVPNERVYECERVAAALAFDWRGEGVPAMSDLRDMPAIVATLCDAVHSSVSSGIFTPPAMVYPVIRIQFKEEMSLSATTIGWTLSAGSSGSYSMQF